MPTEKIKEEKKITRFTATKKGEEPKFTEATPKIKSTKIHVEKKVAIDPSYKKKYEGEGSNKYGKYKVRLYAK